MVYFSRVKFMYDVETMKDCHYFCCYAHGRLMWIMRSLIFHLEGYVDGVKTLSMRLNSSTVFTSHH